MHTLNRRWVVWPLLVILLLLAMAFVWVVVQNRASEKLLAAAAGVFLLPALYWFAERFLPVWVQKSITPMVAAFGALIAVFLFTAPFQSRRAIGTAFLIDATDIGPVRFSGPLEGVMPIQLDTSVLIPTLPREKWKADNDGGLLVYHHLLQRGILQNLVSRADWATEVDRVGSPQGGIYERFQVRMTEPQISTNTINSAFAANRFISAPFHRQHGLFVPPATTLTAVVPGPGLVGVIQLENPLIKLRIETHMVSASTVLYGRYARLTTGTNTNPCCGLVQYTIIVTGQGSWLRRHHPDMPKYAQWVQRITDRITESFDEEERWKVAIQQLTLRHLAVR